MIEHRQSPIRREVNELIRDPQGRVSEAKTWANAGKAICCWLLVSHADFVVAHWDVLMVIVSTIVLPDLLKKIITAKYGAVTK